MWPKLLALCGWIVLSGVWYWPTRRAGWVTDILGLIPRLTEENGLVGALTGYGSPVFHPLTLGVHYLLFREFGPISLAYYVVFVGLHGLTAWMIATAAQRLLSDRKLLHAKSTGTAAGFAFLIHPYVVETVVWRATLNYLLCVPLLLAACFAGYTYGKTSISKWVFISCSATFLALLSFDLAWIAPGIVGVSAALGSYRSSRRQAVTRVAVAFLSTALTLATYLLIKRIVIGTAVGHYGASAHLNADLHIIIPNAWRALGKIVLLTRSYSFDLKSTWHTWIAEPAVYVTLTTVALGLGLAWVFRVARHSVRWELATWVLLGLLLSIAPTANLYFYWLQSGENDRYSYLPTALLMLFLAIGCGAIRGTWLRYGLLVAALSILSYTNREQIRIWSEAAYAQRLLLEDFPESDTIHVYVLAAADNYGGTYLFRDANAPYEEVDASLRFLKGRSPRDTVLNIVGFNQLSLEDALVASVNLEGEIELTFAQPGNWFWNGGVGLTSYETSDYRVRADYPVRVCFKHALPESTKLLYPTGRKWTELDKTGLRPCSVETQ